MDEDLVESFRNDVVEELSDEEIMRLMTDLYFDMSTEDRIKFKRNIS